MWRGIDWCQNFWGQLRFRVRIFTLKIATSGDGGHARQSISPRLPNPTPTLHLKREENRIVPMRFAQRGGEGDKPKARTPPRGQMRSGSGQPVDFHPRRSLKYVSIVSSVGLGVELSPCKREVSVSILIVVLYFAIFSRRFLNELLAFPFFK